MAFKLLTNAHETTTSGDGILAFTLGGLKITLVNDAADSIPFVDELPIGTWTHVTIHDGSGGTWETRKARINTSTEMECSDLIDSSTGSEIVWPATGTRDVVCALAAESVETLVDTDSQAVGAVVRTADNAYEGKAFTPNGAPGSGYGVFTDASTPTLDFTGISDAGNATSLLHKDSSATTTQRKMEGILTLGASSTVFAGHVNERHALTGRFSEKLGEFERIDATNYRQSLTEDNTMVRVVTSPDLVTGDIGKTLIVRAGTDHEEYHLEDWRPVRDYDSDAADFTALSVTVVVPSSGTWDIAVLANLTFDSSGGFGRAEMEINQEIDGPSSVVAVAWGANSVNGFVGELDVVVPYNLLGATGGSSYEFTVDVTASVQNATEAPTPRIHTLFAECTRRL